MPYWRLNLDICNKMTINNNLKPVGISFEKLKLLLTIKLIKYDLFKKQHN